jgi:DNA-binding SARP family transcriptional activator
VSNGTRPPAFSILGRLAITAAGQAVTLNGPSVRGLLGALLLSPGEPVLDDRLLTFVWGPDGGSRRALHCAISRLRTWLQERLGLTDCVVRAEGGYLADVPAQRVDVARFRWRIRLAATADSQARVEHLRTALDEWRGPVLDGGPEWVRTDPTVMRIEASRAHCVRELADLCQQAHLAGVALPYVAGLAEASPYDEPLHARLIELLAADGRRAEALRVVEQVRRRLAEELGVDPSDEITGAHLAVLRSDKGPRRDPSRRAAGLPTPAELPLDIAAFTGRVAERKRLCDLLTTATGPVAITAIAGAAGIGKSALAIHVAHRIADRFPDGQLYVNLQGATAGLEPMDPCDVLRRWLRTLGLAGDDVPTDPQEAAARFRSVVRGRRMLFILDNAADSTQVRPLLPASGSCAVVVTSRQVLATLDDATHLHLDVLTNEEAITLLGRMAGARRVAEDPGAAAEIVQVCDRLPLAVRIAAARLAARPNWPLRVLAIRLADEQRRLDVLQFADLAVRSSFEVSYQDLESSPDEGIAARMYRLLGLVDAVDITTPAAAALACLPPTRAEEALERLVDTQMVESPMPGRYRMHDLIRLFAREQAHREEPESDRTAALRRLLTHDRGGEDDPAGSSPRPPSLAGRVVGDADATHPFRRR